MQRRDTAYLFVLAGIALAGIFVLIAMGRQVQEELWTVASLVIGGAVGIARQDTANPAQGLTFSGAVAPNVSVNAAGATPADPHQPPAGTQPAAPAVPPSLWAGTAPATTPQP
jgi:hypothetical protein